jgi:hypothetical protein
MGSLCGLRARLEFRFFQEVAPAFMVIGGALGLLKFLYGRLCVLLAPDDLDNAGRAVGPHVVPDDRVRRAKIVACQRESIRSFGEKRLLVRKDEKAISEDIAFYKIGLLTALERFQLASPWGPWSRQTARSDPLAGS